MGISIKKTGDAGALIGRKVQGTAYEVGQTVEYPREMAMEFTREPGE